MQRRGFLASLLALFGFGTAAKAKPLVLRYKPDTFIGLVDYERRLMSSLPVPAFIGEDGLSYRGAWQGPKVEGQDYLVVAEWQDRHQRCCQEITYPGLTRENVNYLRELFFQPRKDYKPLHISFFVIPPEGIDGGNLFGMSYGQQGCMAGPQKAIARRYDNAFGQG